MTTNRSIVTSPSTTTIQAPGSHSTNWTANFDYHVEELGLPYFTSHCMGKPVITIIQKDELEAYIRTFAQYFETNKKLTVTQMRQISKAMGLRCSTNAMVAAKLWMAKANLVTLNGKAKISLRWKPHGRILSFQFPK